MTDQATFAAFMPRIRAGDGQAAAELVRLYEPLIRREVRLHLEDRRLYRLFARWMCASRCWEVSSSERQRDNTTSIVLNS